MFDAAKLFSLLTEIILALLGAFLILAAATGRYFLASGRFSWMILDVIFIYWGARAWVRPGKISRRWHIRVRAGSFIIVGLLLLGLLWSPASLVSFLLGAAGGVLVVRGLIGTLLLARAA